MCQTWRKKCSMGITKLRMLSIATIAILITTTYSGLAQCPTGFAGPFTTTITVVLPPPCGTTTVQVEYCVGSTYIGPVSQYRITKVTIVSSGTPCVIDGANMRIIAKALIENNPAGLNCAGNCPTVIPIMKVGWGNCGHTVNGVWEPCPSAANDGCGDLYEICCRCDGTLRAFYKGSSPSDQCEYETGCTTMCPPAGTPEPTQCP